MTSIPNDRPIKIGIAGIGAIGGAVARALTQKGIDNLKLDCICDPFAQNPYGCDAVDFDTLIARADLVVECLPAHVVPELALKTFAAGKDILFISSAALLVYPEILQHHKKSQSRALVPSGALAGLDGVKAMKEMGITASRISTTKKPMGYTGAPHVTSQNIDLAKITEKTRIFEGNALEASQGFPANINVAATLSLASIGGEKTRVEIWADPQANGNAHEITVTSAYSTLTCRIENMPDPQNPKSSILAAQSIVATLRDLSSAIVVS